MKSLIGHMFIVARDLARQQGIAESGYRLDHQLQCKDGGQEVYHLHRTFTGRPRPGTHDFANVDKKTRIT